VILTSGLSVWGLSLKGQYPHESFSNDSLNNANEVELRHFIRLWLMEGIPYCFRELPIAYDVARDYIARQFSADPADVGIIGSGRMGISLAPDKALSRFEPGRSDLDLFMVSEGIWRTLAKEYDEGIAYWESGKHKTSANSNRYITENIKTVRKHLLRGLMDSNKVPSFPGYIPKVARLCEVAVRNVERGTVLANIPIKESARPFLRVYRSWSAAEEQIYLNLRAFVDSRGRG
jgi:hypothetical protein